MNSKLSQRGFTLIEIILVVTILSVMTVFIVPQFSSMLRSIEFKQSVESMSFLMRYAQSRAAVDGKPVRLEFSGDYKEYWLTQINEEKSSSEPVFEKITGRYGRLHSLAKDTALRTEARSVQFYPDGRIDAADIDICQPFRKNEKYAQALEKCSTITTRLKRGSVDIIWDQE